MHTCIVLLPHEHYQYGLNVPSHWSQVCYIDSTDRYLPTITFHHPRADLSFNAKVQGLRIQTQQGNRITHAPVKDSLTLSTPSPGASPSKERTWSSGVVENDNYDNITTDQILKRSRNTGKMSVKIHGC